MASKQLMRAFLNKENGLASVKVDLDSFGGNEGTIEMCIRDCYHTVTIHHRLDSKKLRKEAFYKFNKLKEACDKALEGIASMEEKK